ncbi:SAC3 family protein B [Rhynchospora pubera]|uniref:SAC3 family protein B n=1 Tax=Rhynchospora pubera TaxID=906938 RepID=A0AAV8FL33_9POAL|nr:SAC3 family protein B [Rhynchospora pubera]
MRGPLGLHGPAKALDSLPSRREELAKARRLSRFGDDLSQPVVEVVEMCSETSHQQAEIDFSEATAIVGLCPDMCPEPERAERERTGNLDKHERLDGNRNQTTKSLAVKMYNRTAERDPGRIRPLPVLVRTMDYLLELMDRPYGDDFLRLYNFLWDRMRAVRMDLRMQHISDLDTISMLEQMAAHIIAMHDFCEYNKGEGFSEGFDAHLNIEQMNKASMELFQMYEDHKRKGIAVPTEKEFRGYYALLKLDKHPGYKVEPAELSLDLAKMSSEVRHSPEISFAREVAKACRMGNYISFFRLAKKATFLQACLMHAHFSKLRIEALNSLHSSFTSNKGMPLSRLVEMLAMESTYHFPLCNCDVDFCTKYIFINNETPGNLFSYFRGRISRALCHFL